MKKSNERRTPSNADKGKKKRPPAKLKKDAPAKKTKLPAAAPSVKREKGGVRAARADQTPKGKSNWKPIEKEKVSKVEVRLAEVAKMRANLEAAGDKPLRGSGALKLARGQRGRDWAPAYLMALRECGMLGKAAVAAGVSRQTVWERRANDPSFRSAEEQARVDSAEMLEEEAVRRATQGVRTLKFEGGLPIMDPRTGLPYEEIEYSDGLLTLLLKAHLPNKYRDKVDHEHTGSVHMTLEEFEKRLVEAGAGSEPDGRNSPRSSEGAKEAA